MITIILDNAECVRRLAEQWLREANNGFGIDIDIDTHIKDMNGYIEGSDSDVIALVDVEIVGYMGISCFDNPLSEGRVANEHMWYVEPEHRGMGSIRLFNSALEWAKNKGCSHFIATANKMASELHDRVCKLYEVKGMKHFETTYICEV